MSQEATILSEPTVRVRSQSRRMWQTFLSNRTTIVGLILVVLIILTAVFADDWFIAVFQGREAEPLLAMTRPTINKTHKHFFIFFYLLF